MTKSNMIRLNIHEAKTHLSRYVAKVANEAVTITLCRSDEPVAQIVPLPKKVRPHYQRIGCGKGKGRILKSFFDAWTDEELPGMGL